MPPTEFNPIKKPDHNRLWLVLVVVVIIALAAVLFKFLAIKNVEPIAQEPIINNTLPEGYQYVATGAGEYPPGFPEELVLFEDVEIIRGENTIDGTGASHKIIDFATDRSLEDVTGRYQDELPALSWEVAGKPISQGDLQILNFNKGETELTVIISPKTATSSQINLNIKG